MAEEELQIEEGSKKGKLMIIIIAVVVILVGGAAAYFFLFSGDEEVVEATTEQVEGEAEPEQEKRTEGTVGTALYVAMPRPFVFNVPGSGKDRLVQIKVQLMVRGSQNEELAKSHIPLIEGALLKTFSASNADDLVTEAGKMALREDSLSSVRTQMKDIAGDEVVEQVLFTGFVMQ